MIRHRQKIQSCHILCVGIGLCRGAGTVRILGMTMEHTEEQTRSRRNNGFLRRVHRIFRNLRFFRRLYRIFWIFRVLRGIHRILRVFRLFRRFLRRFRRIFLFHHGIQPESAVVNLANQSVIIGPETQIITPGQGHGKFAGDAVEGKDTFAHCDTPSVFPGNQTGFVGFSRSNGRTCRVGQMHTRFRHIQRPDSLFRCHHQPSLFQTSRRSAVRRQEYIFSADQLGQIPHRFRHFLCQSATGHPGQNQ